MTEFLNAIQDHIKQKVTLCLIKNDQDYSANLDLLSDEAFPTLPTSTNGSNYVPVWKPAQSLSVTERFEIPLDLARPQFGKLSSTNQVCKDTMLKFKSKIEYSTSSKSASITFLVSGSAEGVKQSKKQLVWLLSARVSTNSL